MNESYSLGTFLIQSITKSLTKEIFGLEKDRLLERFCLALKRAEPAKVFIAVPILNQASKRRRRAQCPPSVRETKKTIGQHPWVPHLLMVAEEEGDSKSACHD